MSFPYTDVILLWIDTNATGWIVKKNTLVSQQEILQRGLKNTLRPLPHP